MKNLDWIDRIVCVVVWFAALGNAVQRDWESAGLYVGFAVSFLRINDLQAPRRRVPPT